MTASIDDDRSQCIGLLMSLNMLIGTPAASTTRAPIVMGSMKEAGFRETRVEHLLGPDSMVIGIE